jgi:tetratricopeptide (TPR) repeat protein
LARISGQTLTERNIALTLQLIAAALSLPAMLLAAFLTQRRGFPRAALTLVVITPLCAALVYLGSNRLRVAPAPGPTTPAASAESDSTPQANPTSGRVADLRSQAEEARRAKNYAAAADRFREITQAAPFDPDGWADLGDAQAAAAGGDLSAGNAAIDRALEIDPGHPKALWLKASLELQGKRYAAAADLWRRLLKVLPADSGDAKIVQTNLEEAEKLSRGGAGKP